MGQKGVLQMALVANAPSISELQGSQKGTDCKKT